jgi:hypothetical protein
MRLLQTTSTHGVVHFMEPHASSYHRRIGKNPYNTNGREVHRCICGSYVSINGGIHTAGKPFKGKICARCASAIGDRTEYYFNLWNYDVCETTWTDAE